MLDRPVNGTVIAQLEMQKGVILDTAPITAVKRIRPDQIQRTGNRDAVTLGQNQQAIVAHGVMQDVEKRPGQIRPPPFAPAGVLIKGPERVPVAGPDLIPGQAADSAAKGLSTLTLFADRLALARRKLAQKIVITVIPLIQPVELFAGARQEIDRLTQPGLGFGTERDMRPRQPRLLRKLHH